MDFVRTKDNVIDNIITFERHLHSKDPSEKEFAENLLRHAQNIVVYKVEGENRFAPSSFLGYKNNTMQDHLAKEETDGKDSTQALDKVLTVSSFANAKTEDKFLAYAESIGIKPEKNDRKYWRLKDSRGKNFSFKEEELQE